MGKGVQALFIAASSAPCTCSTHSRYSRNLWTGTRAGISVLPTPAAPQVAGLGSLLLASLKQKGTNQLWVYRAEPRDVT